MNLPTSGRPARRQFGPLALAALVVLAGCGGLGPENRTPETIETTASKATVSDGALSDTGFSESAVERGRLSDSGTLDVSGDVELAVDYRVDATTWRAVYRRGDGVFAAYSVPLAEPDDVAATIDPLGGWSTAEIAARTQDAYGDFGRLTGADNATVSMLGNETTLSKFATTASVNGTTVDVTLYVARVRHDGDVVVAVAVLPRSSDDAEAVRALVGGIRH